MSFVRQVLVYSYTISESFQWLRLCATIKCDCFTLLNKKVLNFQELIFLKGEERKYVLIEIYNDNIAEPDETFEVILANPGNGAILGTPSRGEIISVILMLNDFVIVY